MPVRTFDPASDGMKQLLRAADLLIGVGQAPPATTDPGVALMCLAAAEDLCRLGACSPGAVLAPSKVADAVNDALAMLAALPDDIFATTPVLDAAANVRAARALLADPR